MLLPLRLWRVYLRVLGKTDAEIEELLTPRPLPEDHDRSTCWCHLERRT